MWILIVGNPVDGFTYHGPYSNYDEAMDRASEQVTGGDWWVAPLVDKRTI